MKVYECCGITEITEIAPTSVKRLIAGDGKASKDEVAEGVREHIWLNYKKTMSLGQMVYQTQ